MMLPNRYPIHQSPLFKLSSKKRLSELLKVRPCELKGLLADSNYRVWEDKGRQIQAPRWNLKKVHKRLKDLIARVQTPEWLMSGKKGISYVDNAVVHKNSDFLLNVDITGFYKNSTFERVYQCFLYRFKMKSDVAYLLATLVTWNGIIPTGSPTSQLLAYWANEATFSRIAVLAEMNGLIFTVYVDDLSFSGARKISSVLPFKVNKELLQIGLHLKDKKTRFFGKNDFKIVTGVGISKNKDLVILNVKRKKIIDQLKHVEGLPEDQRLALRRSIRGGMISARQIQASFLNQTYGEYRKSYT